MAGVCDTSPFSHPQGVFLHIAEAMCLESRLYFFSHWIIAHCLGLVHGDGLQELGLVLLLTERGVLGSLWAAL